MEPHTTRPNTTRPNTTRIGYARCSTDKQDLAAQVAALLALGVGQDRIYTDHGFSGTDRASRSSFATTKVSPARTAASA